jgi:hypothetical protein
MPGIRPEKSLHAFRTSQWADKKQLLEGMVRGVNATMQLRLAG